ncbi:hypothetical protein O0I10_000522 [Lichtheimia ornata]|uniref:Retrotransposon gag domain-containing protein n=1 Tax=Lichtheimia ornata TaxID=688661 RepID=A0AAD8DHF8_9FUNG|nr:uncharacterized protein O0I10_000522 [Lichtheimia ornata]KAJ8663284.1 hypothetical protein O0I10_000522 [Lichtheimia ornata]
MTFNHPSPLNNRAFQEYREPIPEPIELSDDESQVTNRQPFIMEGIEQEQESTRIKSKLREPDTYHGTRTPHAAESLLRSVQRYADVTGMMKLTESNMPSIFFEEMLTHGGVQEKLLDMMQGTGLISCKLVLDEFRLAMPNRLHVIDWLYLTQTGTVEEYVNDFRNLCLKFQQLIDDEADRFVRGLAENVQVYVRTQFPTTTAQAERIAFAYEGAMSLHQNARQDDKT